MKKIIFIAFVLFIAVLHCHAQTVISSTLTVDSLSKMPKGSYRFYRPNKDTVDLTKDTIPKCPICPTPIVCPPPTKQRTAVGVTVTITATNKNILITYDDGSTSVL